MERSVYRDGSHWLTPEMYVSYEDFYDTRGAYLNYEGLDPYTALNPFLQYLGYWVTSDPYSPTALLNPFGTYRPCLLYTSPSPRDAHESRMPSSA